MPREEGHDRRKIPTSTGRAAERRDLGRRLADINPVRFGLLGAVVGGVGVPLYLQAMNVLSGDGPVAWGLVTDDAVWATVFGAAVAAGSILLARRADALPRGRYPAQLDDGGELGVLPAVGERDAPVPQRSRSEER